MDLLILDNDGVLVDSEPIANRVLAGLLTEYGDPTTYEETVSRYMGTNLAYVRQVVEAKLGHALPADLERRYHDELFARMRTELTTVAGVEAALDAIDLPTCVASSGTHERIEVALKIVGLYDRFAGRIFSSQDVERGKPYPDLFLRAAEQTGVASASSVVVEDSPHGVEAAKAAGMTVIGYAGMTPAERLADADRVITTMTDLPSALAAAG
ncbi:MAG TPA: HAD family hydrolase [Nocardioidaceae bacterium]|nr:HAD family hydrolase [Nocardioidaceae bacterium]